MNKIYVINKFDEYPIIRYNAMQIIEETDKEIIILDKIEGKNTYLKEDMDKECEFLFVTKDKRKIKKQLKRIYNNIENQIEDEIAKLNYKLNILNDMKERNQQSYKSALDK